MDSKCLIIFAGLPGTGKTTCAGYLSKNLDNYVLINQNDIRRKLGMKKLGKTQERILRAIDVQINNYLSKGNGVIIDSVHRYLFRRHQLYGLDSGCGAKVVNIETICSDEESKRRILKRELCYSNN
jgi:predicted kinase